MLFRSENIIRVGSAGSYTEKAKVFDVVLATGAYSESNYAVTQSGDTDDIQKPSEELNNALRASAKKQGIPLIEGTIHSSDVFYREDSGARPTYWEVLRDEKGCLAVEMESSSHNKKVCYRTLTCLQLSIAHLSWPRRARLRSNNFFSCECASLA